MGRLSGFKYREIVKKLEIGLVDGVQQIGGYKELMVPHHVGDQKDRKSVV